MSERPSRDELRVLFTALHDGTISTDDHARLERALTEDPAARQLWFLQSDLETGLAEWAATRQEPAANVITVPASAFRRAWRVLAPLAAMAAVFALCWRLIERTDAPTRPAAEAPATGIAVLARTVGVEWEGAPLSAGTVLARGTLRMKSGAALVEFYSGTRVVVEGPAEFELVSAGEASLHTGKMNAHVPPQARGFAVGFAGARLVDHGTDFGIDLKGSASPEVHVFTGAVEVALPKQTPLSLREGDAVRLGGAVLARIPPMRSSFLTEAELARRDATQTQTRAAAWRDASHALAEESAAVVHFSFAEADAAERRLANRITMPAAETHGVIIGGTWTDGRWPGQRALEFRGEGDRVRFTAPLPMHDVTLLAWVRVNSLSRAQNVLLAADAEQPGALHWHLTEAGALRLEIARDLGRQQPDWEAVNSEPFVTPTRFGQWLLLATTFDGKTIRHYGNGRLIGSGASFKPPQIVIGSAELANWRGLTQRRLAAALDEFVILSRALSAQEIADYYAAGRP